MPASICSTFHIILDETLNTSGGDPPFGQARIINPGRPFRVTSVLVTGAVGAVVDVLNGVNGLPLASSPVTGLTAGDLNDFPCEMNSGGGSPDIPANVEVIVQSLNANNITRVLIICEAIDPQALTVTTAA